MDPSDLPPGLPGCPRCTAQAKRIAELEATVADLLQTVERLEAKIHTLEEKLGRNSRNSSLPPSADPPGAPAKPPKPRSGRKPGGQPGHEGKSRGLLPIEAVDELVIHAPAICESCHGHLPRQPGPADPEPRRHQIFELPEVVRHVTEHQCHGRTCRSCGHLTWQALPPELPRSSFGPRLVALGSFLTGVLHASRRQVEELYEHVLDIPIALGSVSNLEAEVTKALEPAYEEAGDFVRSAGAKNLDETGWREKGGKSWLWLAATATVAVFSVHSSRGKAGLMALLGGTLRGIFCSDRWAVYAQRAVRFRQICWAHLLRDFEKLVDRGGKSAELGRRAKALAEDLFSAWRDFKDRQIDREELRHFIGKLRKTLREILAEGARLELGKTTAFCENLILLEPALWTFARVEGVEPTNNHAERVLRKGVLWRKGSFGTKSDRGSRFVERILTVVETCRLQRRGIFSFLVEAVRSHRLGAQAPSILPV